MDDTVRLGLKLHLFFNDKDTIQTYFMYPPFPLTVFFLNKFFNVNVNVVLHIAPFVLVINQKVIS